MDNISNFTLASVLRENARSRGARLAIVDGKRRFTYLELRERVDRLAAGLAERGVGSGSRILWLGQNSASIIELLLACARLGAVLCAANWRQSAEELVWVIHDFQPTIVFWQQTEIGERSAEARLRAMAVADALWLEHDDEHGVDALLADTPFQGEDPPANLGVYALYTAAFDGRPQAAVLCQTAILFQNLMLGRDQAIEEDSVFLNSGPMFHIGTMMTTFAVLHHGGLNVILRRADASEILDLIEREGCTHAFLTPPTIAEMKIQQADKPRWLSSLWPSGEVTAPPGVLAMPPDAPMHNRPGVYGQSELTGLITRAARGGGGGGKAALAEIRIVNDNDEDVPDGTPGEIVVRSPLVMNGYFDRDEENARRRRNGWYHTRDLGCRRPDGAIDFVAPKGVLIKSASENIYPVEVELCLKQHPAVSDVCVIGIPDEVWGQSVKAVVVLKPDAMAEEFELITHCKARIASYKKPRYFAFVTELPRSASGLVDRAAVDSAYGGGGYPSAT